MNGEGNEETIQRMVGIVEPEWEVTGARPVERGFSAVYSLDVRTPGGDRECFLKVSTGDQGVAVDARITAILGKHTSVPVPRVIGVVDTHADVPAPFFLASAMPGTARPYEAVGRVSDDHLRATARDVGACLGELHRIDAVESFGHVTHEPSRTLEGEEPSGTVADLAVADPRESWPAYLRDRIDHATDRLGTTRFGDLAQRVDAWCRKQTRRLAGPHTPVLGRNDHGFHNLLVDPETGEVTAMLDWAYTLAVPPRFDFQFGVYLFGGAFMSAVPGVRDRRKLVRSAMVAGYRSTAPGLADAVTSRCSLYELLAILRVMNDFEELRPRLPSGADDDVADDLRRQVEATLDSA